MSNEKWKIVISCSLPSASCLLPSAVCLLLYVFMQQLKLIALFAQLNAKQVAYRKHPDPPFAVDYWQVPAANLFHSLERLMRCFVAANHGAQGAGNFTQAHICSIQARYDYPVQKIAFREYAYQSAFLVKH